MSANSDQVVSHKYTASLAAEIELKWQSHWEDDKSFRALNPGDPGFSPEMPKFYCLDMFPYPSGEGLHVGHPEGYTGSDIISRFKLMKGCNVLHPMGFDAFGLPAEQYAVATNVHPAVTTAKATEVFRSQLKRFGFAYDWSREFSTTDPDYYRWTQWIWLKAYDSWFDQELQKARPISELVDGLDSGDIVIDEGPGWSEMNQQQRREYVDSRRLAYLGEQVVNWCPALGTVLANEEVIDGRSERGGHPVRRMSLRQWMFRIREYADRLLEDLSLIDWPESTRQMQTEWIGRSEGGELNFTLDSPVRDIESLEVFTTRPDTVFGATYMVVAPEHPLVEALLEVDGATDRFREYVMQARNRSDVDRMIESREKTGVDTGVFAINPATGQPIPVFVADYVLMGYGTGAIMAVPAHDARDHEFARTFGLDITRVVDGPGDVQEQAYTEPGVAMNSSNDDISLDGLGTDEACTRMLDWFERNGKGARRVNYRLRDWLFSRQRYWGEPFPIVFDEDGNHYPVSEEHLPVLLPEMDDFKPVESDTPMPPLGRATDWVATTAGEAGVSPDLLPPDTPVRRETNTMPNWAGSCWYYLRYIDPHNQERLVDPEAERYWMLSNRSGDGPSRTTAAGEDFDADQFHVGGVDLYVGGAEHAVLHLLYARFWHKILFDRGYVSTPEPVGRLFHQGMILAFAYQRDDKSLVPVDQVRQDEDESWVEIETGREVSQVVAKMSKSLRNVVNPDDVINEYGVDTLRLYLMYMGPLDATKPWNTRDIKGIHRFLQRVWRLAIDEESGAIVTIEQADEQVERMLHATIKKVDGDIPKLAFNTAIASMIELVNKATGPGMTSDQLSRFTRVLAPFAPHLAEEIWSRIGETGCISHAEFPSWDETMLASDQVEIPIQVKGKIKARILVASDADQETLERLALENEQIIAILDGNQPRKVIVVPGRMINIVP
ncbi:MAG: leucine--tRNA ligase [Phycisphaerae bacterium]|nr:leucine--tRNA ligase [Phycisphaerae bacterium]